MKNAEVTDVQTDNGDFPGLPPKDGGPIKIGVSDAVHLNPSFLR